ncbi:AAA family ATPase [Roseicitreum antarcticum]|nr:AAA family ATPase [Roseicitreum antarcticum]
MASIAKVHEEAPEFRACTVSRDIGKFELLIEDMEVVLGDAWGDLSFQAALTFLEQPDAAALEFLAVVMDEEDEAHLTLIRRLIKRAREKDIRVLLVAEELSPILLHQLLRLGADDFLPYPLPEDALRDVLERLRQPPLAVAPGAAVTSGGGKRGAVLAVQSMAGGAGGSTFAVNLAGTLAQISKDDARSVCLLDLDLQRGSVSTYLDMPRTERVYELLSNLSDMDGEAFTHALQPCQDRMKVLTAPADMLPFDILSVEDVASLIAMARSHFDYVIIDMPGVVVQWTEAVLNAADVYFALLLLDMRSAQNTLRLIRALSAEDLSTEKLRFVLNRAPKFTDLAGKSRAKRMAESLDISFQLMIPDGLAQVSESNDHGLLLANFAPKNPVHKEIRKLAEQLYDLDRAAEAAGS